MIQEYESPHQWGTDNYPVFLQVPLTSWSVLPQTQFSVAVKFPFWKHSCSTSYVSAILVSKRIWNKKTFQEELRQLWLVGTCGWTQLGPYERCKMFYNSILLCVNSVGNKPDQTVLYSQAVVFETHLCLIFMFSETDSYSGLDSTEFP